MSIKESELDEFFQYDICFNIRRTAKPITNLYNSILKERGFEFQCTQYHAFIVLYQAYPNKMSAPAIASKLLMDRTTVVRNFIRPIERGLIKETISERSPRTLSSTHYCLTDKGKKSVEEVIPVLNKINALVGTDISYSPPLMNFYNFKDFMRYLVSVGDLSSKIKWKNLEKFFN